MSRTLPESPNLDHLKKQAKVLLRELQQRNSAAKLAEAQHALAGEYGFASWLKLKAHVESLPRVPAAASVDAAKPFMEAAQRAYDPAAATRSLFGRYTETARRVLFFSRHEADQHRSPRIWPPPTV